MKTYLSLVVVVGLFFSVESSAQTADLQILLPSASFPITLDETKVEASVVNRGASASQPFELRLWVSVDNVFNNDDQPITLDQTSGLAGYSGSGAFPETPSFERKFRFPLPEQVTNPSDRLFGDSRTPSQWIGQTLYTRACISLAGGPFNDCRTEERVVIAPRAELQSASRGTSTSAIDVRWAIPPADNGQSLVSHYALRETRRDSTGGRRSFTIPVADLAVVDEPNGQESYQYIVTGMERGVYHSYSLQACNEVGVALRCQNGGSEVAGAFAKADFSASDGTETGGIQVTWRQFSVFTEGYDVRRCLASAPSDCAIIAFNVQATDYFDSDVERGVDYIYEIFSCNRYIAGTTECEIFNSNQVSDYHNTGVTNLGTPNLIDQYEVDDTPAQASRVRSTVSQLRSFHTPDDQDWVEIILSKPQVLTIVTSGDTNNDTELVLYQADATTEISGDVGSGPGLYAQLTTEVLPAGRYYLNLYQRNLGIPALFKPVANYRLDITIEERRAILAPIIDLLLGDD